MRISCRAGRHGRGQPVSIVSGPDSRSGGYVSGPLMSRDTRAVRASGLDHDITDTPTVDRHEQTRVERSTIEAGPNYGGGSGVPLFTLATESPASARLA